MNSLQKIIVGVFVLATSMAAQSNDQLAFGRSDPPVPPANEARAAAKKGAMAQHGAKGSSAAKDPNLSAPSPIGSPGFLGPRKRRHIANVNKLRGMIKDAIELSPEQKEKIDRLSDDFIAEIKNSPPMVPLPTLKMPDNVTNAEDRTPQWIENIRAEMKPEQVESFQRVVGSWRTISERMPILGPFLYLQRAIRDPELNLPQEQLTALDALMDDTMWTVMTKYPYLTDEVSAEIAEKGLVAVKEKLTPQQQAKVDADVRKFAADDKEIRESIKPGIYPIGGAGSSVETGECKTLGDAEMQELKNKSLEQNKTQSVPPKQP